MTICARNAHAISAKRAYPLAHKRSWPENPYISRKNSIAIRVNYSIAELEYPVVDDARIRILYGKVKQFSYSKSSAYVCVSKSIPCSRFEMFSSVYVWLPLGRRSSGKNGNRRGKCSFCDIRAQ